MGAQPTSTRKGAKRFERLRHIMWAGLIALVLHVLTLLAPVDQLGWIIQSRVADKPASGEIVFVGSDVDLANSEQPQSRQHLARFISRLDEIGANAVFVDFAFEQASTPSADAALNQSLQDFSGDSYLVRRVELGLNGDAVMDRQTAAIGNNVEQIGFEAWFNYLGYVWEMQFTSSETSEELPNFSTVLAGSTIEGETRFPVNYAYDITTIPTLRFRDVAAPDADLRNLAGKTIVIGPTPEVSGTSSNVPGYIGVASSMVAIYGAETLKAGDTEYIGGWIVLAFAILLLAAVAAIKPRGLRYTVYGIAALAIPTGLIVSGILAVRASVADALAFLLIYGFYRARVSWQSKMRLVDSDTNLPTFVALEADDEVSDTLPAIIVAKIHRFEEVRRTLPADQHADYLLAITGRLKAATQDATIYLGQGHLIAWTLAEKDPALLREHLEGLRALFSSPLIVGDTQVDVGITFGIDISPSPNVARRLAAAVAAAEKTNETFEPIAIADTASQEDLIWNISLQARIDAALANGEIYLAFQPKIMVRTGEIIGAEVLVRWNDPVRGHIPPDHFIRQCETAGRMTQLTRFVLEEACTAGNAFADEGLNLPIAVNVSATLLHERSIVQMVSDVLEQTGFEPRRLTLEITETYRISNLDLAAEILGELKDLGCKISMDDFGVGAASLEALLRLPFSELKIDRIFIAPITTNPKALGIVKNILKMGKDLRIIVVAEGIEDAATLTLLRDSGCLVAQGYAISRPITFDKILHFHRDTQMGYARNMV